METKVVSLHPDNLDIRVVVGEETAIARMRHARAKAAAIAAISDDEDENIMRIVFYPDAIAATVEFHGFVKPTFEEFMQLPGDFVDRWVSAVWDLIPAWRDQSMKPADRPVDDPDADEKKEKS
jgi:hypothetical protein